MIGKSHYWCYHRFVDIKSLTQVSDQMPLSSLFMRVAMIARGKVAQRLSNEEWFIKANLRIPCVIAIHGIAKLEPVSQIELASWVGVDPSDLVAILDLLENAKYLTRNRDPADRRRQLLSLTIKGNEAREKLLKIGAESMGEILEPLKISEREILHEMLSRVFDHHEISKLESEK